MIYGRICDGFHLFKSLTRFFTQRHIICTVFPILGLKASMLQLFFVSQEYSIVLHERVILIYTATRKLQIRNQSRTELSSRTLGH